VELLAQEQPQSRPGIEAQHRHATGLDRRGLCAALAVPMLSRREGNPLTLGPRDPKMGF
jgi:hypothetical protein